MVSSLAGQPCLAFSFLNQVEARTRTHRLCDVPAYDCSRLAQRSSNIPEMFVPFEICHVSMLTIPEEVGDLLLRSDHIMPTIDDRHTNIHIYGSQVIYFQTIIIS
jgi:hypothetical protein